MKQLLVKGGTGAMTPKENQPAVGDFAPQFCLPDQQGQEVCLESFKGKWAVLYFYPKDNTSG